MSDGKTRSGLKAILFLTCKNFRFKTKFVNKRLMFSEKTNVAMDICDQI